MNKSTLGLGLAAAGLAAVVGGCSKVAPRATGTIDLAVQSVGVSQSAGGNVTLKAKVANLGTGTSEPAVLVISRKDPAGNIREAFRVEALPGLNGGESYTLRIPFGGEEPGEYAVQAAVRYSGNMEPKDDVRENNSATVEYTVK